jgi:hypothetical protein
MKTTRGRQAGLTLIGLIFILSFIAIVVLFVLRAFPLYNEKFQVIAAMNSAATSASADMTDKEIEQSFLKSLQATTNIQRFSDRNLKEYAEVIKPEDKGEPKQLRVHYQASNVLAKDLNLMLIFDHKVSIRGNASGGSE